MRIIAETLAAIREAIGPGLAFDMKFAGDDFIDRVWWTRNHGNTLDDAKEIAKRLELVSESIYPSGMPDRHTLQTIHTRLYNKGVVITPLSGVKEVQGNTVVTYNTLTGTERQIKGVETVVFCTDGRANDALYRSLKGKVKELYEVGQCVSPRPLLDSIADGYRVGKPL